MRTLSSISLILGTCSLVAVFIIPALIGFDMPDIALRLMALIPPAMMLAGLVTALAARRRGEPSRRTSTALAWNALLLILYGAMLVGVFMNPVTPS